MTSHVESVSLDRYVEEPPDQEEARATTIALFHEGALDQNDTEFVQGHLVDCAECAEVLESLREITSVLGDTPVPPISDELIEGIDGSGAALEDTGLPPLPPEAADRIEAALAEEREHHVAAAREGNQDAAQVLTLTPGSRNRRWLPYLLIAAAGIFLFGGGFAGVTTLMSEGGSGTQQPVPSADAPAKDPEDPEAALPYHPKVVESGTSYTEADLSGNVARLLSRMNLDAETSEDEEPSTTPSFPAELMTCVHELGVETGRYPSLIDIAEYEGESAWIVIYETEGADGRDGEDYLAKVVSDTCGTADSAQAEVLDEATVSGE